MRRVVVTGMASISPLGSDWEEINRKLKNEESAVVYMDDWDKYEDLNTRLGSPVAGFEKPAHYSRKATRSMDSCALMATRATELALEQAGLLNSTIIQDGRMGVSYGSSSGSTEATTEFANMVEENRVGRLNATSYIRMMAHTAPVNIGIFFGIKGRIITTSSACTSGSQGLGYAYEAIKFGRQSMMVAGGAEALCPTHAAVFDTLYATSTSNNQPERSPRPFDKNRDGLVIGSGAGSLILEDLEHAQQRGAKIHAEIVGFGTNADGVHVTQPTMETMRGAIERALTDAQIEASAIGYISAHGTATDRGDIAESHATAAVFGKHVPISSMKSYMGHSLGACGALEAIASIEMMNQGWFHPTLNLEQVDPNCADLDYIRNGGRYRECDYVMSNNFAFGGINTSLIFRRWQD